MVNEFNLSSSVTLQTGMTHHMFAHNGMNFGAARRYVICLLAGEGMGMSRDSNRKSVKACSWCALGQTYARGRNFASFKT